MLTLYVGAPGFGQTVEAHASPKPPLRSLDQELLDGLRSIPPSGLPAGEDARPRQTSAGEDVGRGSESPLADIGRRMRRVETQLRQRDTSPGTRQLQDRIARDLARMIDERQQASAASSSPRQTANQSARKQQGDPTTGEPSSGELASGEPSSGKPDSKGPSPRGDATAATEEEARFAAQSVWGVLPDRVRQQIQQLANEEFLPEFAAVIREYYQRLAELGSKRP